MAKVTTDPSPSPSTADTPPAAPAPAGPSGASSARSWPSAGVLLQRNAVLIAFLAMVAFFSYMRPDTFATRDNWVTMLQLAAPLAILAFGVTVVLAVGDFDLSIAGSMSLCSAIAVVLMSQEGMLWPVAVLVGVLSGVVVGAANGWLVSYLGASSFIITLAAGQILDGGQLLVTDQSTIFQGIPAGFLEFTSGSRVILVALVVAALLWLFLAKSEGGRYVYAIGINRTAARFAGLRVKWWRLVCFAVVGATAATAGIVLASRSAAETPGMGTPYLLPAYAAAFLGSVVGRPGRFTIIGTCLGVVFLQVIQTGLAMLTLPGPTILIIEGAVLGGAILFSRLGQKAEQ